MYQDYYKDHPEQIVHDNRYRSKEELYRYAQERNRDIDYTPPINPKTDLPYTIYDIQNGDLPSERKKPEKRLIKIPEAIFDGRQPIPMQRAYPVSNDIAGSEEQTATGNPIMDIIGSILEIPNFLIETLGGLFK